jgi:hypothetical protein
MSARTAFGVKKEPLTSGEHTTQRCKPPCPQFNYANLNTNLITKLDLSGVVSVQTTGEKYVIDPDGTLFGTNVCGLNNYLKYRQDNQ